MNDAASIAHAVVDASSADEFDAVTTPPGRRSTTLTVTEGGSATYRST